MANTANVSYGTVQAWGQMVPVPTNQMFTPAPAAGPAGLRGAGYAVPLTLPPGVGGAAAGNPGGTAGGANGPMGLHKALLYAGMFVVGFLLLKYIHWSGN